jgi:TonB family protein
VPLEQTHNEAAGFSIRGLKARAEALLEQGNTVLDVPVCQYMVRVPSPLVKTSQEINSAGVMFPKLDPVFTTQKLVFYHPTTVTGMDDASATPIGDFVYISGSFRYLGPYVLPVKHSPVLRTSVDSAVQIQKLVSDLRPVYPALARMAKIEGTVKLHVIVGIDGTVQQAELIGGPPLRIKAALDAVRTWRFSMTL